MLFRSKTSNLAQYLAFVGNAAKLLILRGFLPYKQEVRGSSPRPPTTQTKRLLSFNDERRGCHKGVLSGQTASAALEFTGPSRKRRQER